MKLIFFSALQGVKSLLKMMKWPAKNDSMLKMIKFVKKMLPQALEYDGIDLFFRSRCFLLRRL